MELTSWLSSIGDALSSILEEILQHLPAFISAVTLLVAGWVLAKILQAVVSRLIGRLDRILQGKNLMGGEGQIGVQRSAGELIGRLIFWTVLFVFIVAATEALGLSVVSALMSGMAFYLPNVLAAVLIGFAGVLGGNLLRNAVTRGANTAGLSYGNLLGRVAQSLIIIIAFMVAVDQVGIDIWFLMILISMILGTLLGGLALAFGLGAKGLVTNLIAAHYFLRIYQVGQTLRIGDIRGRVVEVTSTAVILDTQEGRIVVPARTFSEEQSVLIVDKG